MVDATHCDASQSGYHECELRESDVINLGDGSLYSGRTSSSRDSGKYWSARRHCSKCGRVVITFNTSYPNNLNWRSWDLEEGGFETFMGDYQLKYPGNVFIIKEEEEVMFR